MTTLLTLAATAAAVNLGLLLVLGAIWVRAYRTHGATHTIGLLIFAGFLLVQNAVWLYFYQFHTGYANWFVVTAMDVQIGLLTLCGLETIALFVLTWITWQ